MARPRRSSRRRSSPDEYDTRKKNIVGTALILAVLAIAGTLFYFYQTREKDIRDPATGCPKGGGISITTVIIDGSDEITERQQAFLRNHLEAIKLQIPLNGALEVYRLGADPQRLLEPVISVCNPGRGSDVDPLTGSQKRAEKLWKEAFQEPLEKVFDNLLKPGSEALSPIFESIQSIAITSYANPQWQGKPKRLVIVSDMLQYTKDFSHYQGPGNFEAFAKTPYYRRVRADLAGVEVTVFYIPRKTGGNTQGPAHQDFWKSYFLDQGARRGEPALFVHVAG